MSKNVNNDVSKDSPISEAHQVVNFWLHFLLLKSIKLSFKNNIV